MRLFLFRIYILLIFLPLQKATSQKLTVIPYVSGISAPIDLKHCGDDRLFVADRTGQIRIINADGTLRPTPFLSITSKISSNNSEEGFLGIAFSPDYKTSGKFYVDYTSNIAGQLTSVIQEYKVSSSDSNIADLSSALTILTQAQPFSNHNGGNLMFGKDGYLYINVGDGGNGGDPYNNGQNKNTFLAKILRIDVSKSSVAQPYSIPPTNPFYNDTTAGIKKEIWAYGVRNPWKSSVDRLTGDLWIADVGQSAVEEIDFQPANAKGGRNYGWRIMEGNSCYNPSVNCNKAGITLPIFDYSHAIGNSITGGYIYRSAQSKAMFGVYLFADFVQKWVDGIKQTNGVLSGTVTHYILGTQSVGNPISFGEDRFGDQYIIFLGNGTIYKLADTSSTRRPKAYFTPYNKGSGLFLLQALQGRNLTYQWLKDNVVISGAISPDYTTSLTGKYTLEVTNALNFKDTSDAFLLGSAVNFLAFTAEKISENFVALKWGTASELNIAGYTIQRRKDNETSFADIAFVNSKSVNGSSNNELDYSFVDSINSTYSKLFYRLRIQHADSSFTYSDIQFISSDGTANGFLLFPNPARRMVNIFLNKYTQEVVMIIYDITGKKLKQQVLSQQNTTVQIPSGKGVYIIKLSNKNGSNRTVKKLLIE